MKTQGHPQKRKYITYRNAVRGGSNKATGNMQMVKFGRAVFKSCEQTDRRTDILITILRTPLQDEVCNHFLRVSAHSSIYTCDSVTLISTLFTARRYASAVLTAHNASTGITYVCTRQPMYSNRVISTSAPNTGNRDKIGNFLSPGTLLQGCN